jgi:two-component system sensor histidine kinase AlgZ
VALLIGAALTLMLATRQKVALPAFLVMSMISLCFAVGYIGIHRLVFDRWLLRARTWWSRMLLHAAAILVATLAGGGAALLLLEALGGRVSAALRLRVLGVGLAVLVAVRLLQLGYEGLRQQVRESELREERASRQALRAELAALQARTDPHFLFNGLNTIAGLIEEDPQRAVQVVTRLGSFFRHNLQSSRTDTVALGDELRAATAYLEIQSLRFDDRLTWQVDSEPGLDAVRVPPLLLQPLVENAVLHGTSDPGRRVHVVVAAERIAEQVRLTIDDDGPGPGGSTHRGAGTSLRDLVGRLRLIHGDALGFETGRSPRSGFRVRITLPPGGARAGEVEP